MNIPRRVQTLALALLPAVSACSGGGTSSVPLASGGSISPQSFAGPVAISAPVSNATVPTLFADTFATGNFNQFTTLYGKFAACAASSTSWCSLAKSDEAAAGDATWGDYTATSAITISTVNEGSNQKSGAELLFRLTDTTHFYSFDLVHERNGSSQWQLWKNSAGFATNLARGPFGFALGTPYRLSVSAIGSHFIASISKDAGATYQVLGSAEDSTFPVGKIGIRAFNGAAASFDHITVGSGNSIPSPTPAPSATATASATATPPGSPGAYPTMTPIPVGAPPDTAYTIPAPSQPIPETTPGPLCIAGNQYAYVLGDDFTQETQGQLNRYTTQWEINQYQYGGAKTNWIWSDQYSGIGRRNDFGAGDTYMVHIDDANPSRSFPAAWANTIVPRPGNLIMGTPPNAYLDVRAVAVPAQYVGDSRLNSAHWLTGALQSKSFSFGYTEASVQMPANDGSWAAVWDLQVPGGGGYDGTGTSPSNYWEIDTLEKFGNTMGLDGIQQTTNSGRSSAQFVRPQTAGASTSYHSYGQLWVPSILGKPAYIVFYVDRKPTSFYLAPTGVGNMNMNLNLQMGSPGSFVGTPDKTTPADMKIKNYFTWQPTGSPCDSNAQSNPIPTPAPSGTPVPPPPVASNVIPKLQPYSLPLEMLSTTQTLSLATMPANGDLLIAQGVSNFATCPTGFKYTGNGAGYLCTGIVGQNGLAAAQRYLVGGAGFDIGALVDIRNVTSYAINTDTSTGWHSDLTPTITKSQVMPGSNELALAFAYDITDSPRYPTSASYSSNLGYNTLYRSDGNSSFGRGIAMMESNSSIINIQTKQHEASRERRFHVDT